MFFFHRSTADVQRAVSSPELAWRVHLTRERALHEMLPVSMTVGMLIAFLVLAVLESRISHTLLWSWVGARMAISVARVWHAVAYFRRGPPRPGQETFRDYRILAGLDGLVWGALGWALTPVFQLDVAVVSIGVLVGVAALGTFMLHVDYKAAAAFIVPMTLPNAVHMATRQDDLGWFGCVTVGGLMCLLLIEAYRSNTRILELLALRVQSEQVAEAQADALKQAEALSETRSRFVATMSHEMRTPLHGILGLVRLLYQREHDAQALHQLELIRGSGEHLVHVINDILDFSRMEGGSLPLHEEVFDLRALVREITDTANVGATEKGLSLTSHLAFEGDATVRGDPVRVRQVLHNLMGNAVKFTPSGFVRLLVARQADDRMVFEVQDSGIGIGEQELPRIFEAFHQAEGTYQRRFGGTGLGLTISRELCRAMGGDLSCRSIAGQGSTFTFVVPLVAASVDEPVPLAMPAPGRAAETARPVVSPAIPGEGEALVLLVEDNPVNALVAEIELQRLGVQVCVVTNGREAVDWLSARRADLVLMDCEMPEMDGFEATRRIRARECSEGGQGVCIVALTANGNEGRGDRYTSVGMDDYLAKPFRPEDLARILRRHLGKAPAVARIGSAPEAAATPMAPEPPAAARLSMG
ncbi:MAG: response regulator [Rubrivivax sp.]|nr:MAG: response regulator [Rubrivivax sp.]